MIKIDATMTRRRALSARRNAKRGEAMRKVRGTFLLAGVLLLPGGTLPQSQAPAANAIRVEINGLRNDKGQVHCALYSSAEGFPKRADKAAARVIAPITDKRAVCEFLGAAPGTYAVSVFHDENSNGKLDTNFMGIPREGVGASNGARGHLGPPKFDAAAFRFQGGRLELKITIAYL
jgi:uncharacterized protein (DUF2141 family)